VDKLHMKGQSKLVLTQVAPMNKKGGEVGERGNFRNRVKPTRTNWLKELVPLIGGRRKGTTG